MITVDELRRHTLRAGLEDLEHRISTLVRHYSALEEPEWPPIENALLRLVLDVATLDSTHPTMPDGVTETPITVLARALGNSRRATSDSTRYLGVLGTLCFAA